MLCDYRLASFLVSVELRARVLSSTRVAVGMCLSHFCGTDYLPPPVILTSNVGLGVILCFVIIRTCGVIFSRRHL